MARPTKNDSERLSHTLPPVRCTEEEKKEIKSKSSELGLSISEYVRQMVLKGKINIKHSKADFELVQQLRKLGINLNQQTKKLNSTGVVPVELKPLWKKLDGILDKLMEV